MKLHFDESRDRDPLNNQTGKIETFYVINTLSEVKSKNKHRKNKYVWSPIHLNLRKHFLLFH